MLEIELAEIKELTQLMNNRSLADIEKIANYIKR